MGFGQGSYALRRFRLLAPPQKTPFAWIIEKLETQLISPLGLDDSKESAVGFCHPFTGEPSVDGVHSLVYEGSLVFGLRIDKKRVPPLFLKLQVMSALESLGHAGTDAEGAPKKIAKKIRDGLKDKLREELLKATLPAVRLVEFMWNLESNEISVYTASGPLIQEFEKIFQEATGLPLVALTAGTACIDFDRLQLGLPFSLEPYLNVEPVSFSAHHEPEPSPPKISVSTPDQGRLPTPF